MSLLPDIESILRNDGYRIIHQLAIPASVAFEDHSLLGFVVEYDSVGTLLETWRKNQESFLKAQALSLRRAEQKAWNCYSVHITSDPGSKSQIHSLLAIEEDFMSTRKIAKAALATRKDLIHALGPLLPLQNVTTPETRALETDLKARLREWPSAAVEALLGDAATDDILTLLLGAE